MGISCHSALTRTPNLQTYPTVRERTPESSGTIVSFHQHPTMASINSLERQQRQGDATNAAAAFAGLLPLNITRLAPEFSSSPRLSTQSLPPRVRLGANGSSQDTTMSSTPVPDRTAAATPHFTNPSAPSSMNSHHLESPPSSSHHTPTTPTFDLSTRPVSYVRGFSPYTMSRLSGTGGSVPTSPGAWRDSTMSQSNFRDSMATVTSSRSFNIRDLPEVCVKFPLPPPKETDEMRRSESSTPSVGSTLVASASLASVATNTTGATVATSRAPSPPAEVQVATFERVPVARGMQVRQVAETSEDHTVNRMSLVSTETGESVGWMPMTDVTGDPSQQTGYDSKPWLPVLAPVWGSGSPPAGRDAYNLLGSTPPAHPQGGRTGNAAAAEPEQTIPRTSTDTFNSRAFNSTIDHTGRLAPAAPKLSQTRESLAAWDEDMPKSTLVSEHPLTSDSTNAAMADYDSDSDASDRTRDSDDASPFGRNSFGCDARDDDATEDRARKLREGFFANPAAGRSHSSIDLVADRAKTPTRTMTRSLGSVDSTRNLDPALVGLRPTVLAQPMVRYSTEALRDRAPAPPPVSDDVQLRKKSLTNLLRRREDEKRKSEDKKLPPLPAAVQETEEEYYIDTNPESVYNVCNDKYLRKSFLSPPEPEADEVFDVWRPPSQRRLWEAGTCTIRNEDGELLPFSDLFPKWEDAKPNGPVPRTMFIFLRHFWCGPCQDYTLESISALDPKLLAAHNVKVYIIGSGHWKLIKSYRTLFDCPFPFFTDGPRRLFGLLGMIKKASMLPFNMPFRDAERASYNHRPLVKQAMSGFKNAFLHMPIGNPGNWSQLGGEFILSPGYKCEFAHRMTTMTSELEWSSPASEYALTVDHMEAYKVVRHIGINHPSPAGSKIVKNAPTKKQVEARDEIDRLTRELRQWQDDRDAEMMRMRNKRSQRAGGLIVPVDDKAYRRISATSGWSGYVRNVLQDDAAAELSHMPRLPNKHKNDNAVAANAAAVPRVVTIGPDPKLEHPVIEIGPEVVTIGPESAYVSKSSSSGDRSSNGSTGSRNVPDLVDSQSASTGADADESIYGSQTCSLDPEVSATFGGIRGSPVEPEDIDPAEMERRFTAAMAAARGQERTAAALNHRWSMPPQLPRHSDTPVGEVGVAY